ncbi:MAG: alpha/beta fold hydrolase [Pseudomonadaceae bacterium]|nr:MAG: alpha/beta fold hydrolase [Pseudomonadaceae bacterium]
MMLQHPAGASRLATLVLAHGAGAPMDSPYMELLTEHLLAEGLSVLRFEFPYMVARRADGRKRPPNPMAQLEQAFLQQLDGLEGPLLVAGKSMGGRVATHILQQSAAVGAVAFGYPFHPPGKPDRLRIAHLQAIAKPLLVVQGTRDPFGREHEVAEYALASSVELCWLSDGEHDLRPTKSSGRTQVELISAAAGATGDFARRLVAY